MTQSKHGQPATILDRLWPPLLFLAGCLLAAGVYYFLYYEKKSSYLTSRDFRYLAAIGQQTRDAIERQGKIFANLALKPEIVGTGSTDPRREQEKARYLRDLVPYFENVAPQPMKEWGEGNLLHRVDTMSTGSRLQFFYAPPQGKSPVPSPFVLTGEISFERLLQDYFQFRGAFESILLADAHGRVVYQQATADLSILRLDELAQPRRGEKARGTPSLFGSSDYFDVEISGRSYRVFVEPVSLPINAFPGGHGPPGPHVTGQAQPWLICGLVARKALVYKSMAVSSALILACIGALLLALLSWPFIKLRLLGEGQRVGVFDVLLLGLCSLLVVSVLTIFLLDLFAFGAFKGLAAHQVEALGERMKENVRAEIRAAFAQLAALEGLSKRRPVQKDKRESGDALAREDLDVHDYPFFDLFSVLDAQGMQRRKWALDTSVSARFAVTPRLYFRAARDGDTWWFPDPVQPDRKVGPFVIEPIVGWGNGSKAAVLSMPTGKPDFPVATLSIPMLSLINPVLPPGFSFAVIDPQGKVLFHSDSRRNDTENLFVETDQDRRLRSAVFARRAETMTLRYWGEDYIAHTAPVERLPWTIVTLRDLRTLRSVNVEWISSTLVFLLLYLGTLAALLALVAGSRPGYRAGWVWPAPDRAAAHLDVALLFVLLAGAFLLAILRLRAGEWLLALSWMLPFLALVLAYLKLETHGSQGPKRIAAEVCGVALATVSVVGLLTAPPEHGAGRLPGGVAALLVAAACAAALWRPREPAPEKERRWHRFRAALPVSRTYPLAGVMLLLLAAALPTAGMFKVAHRVQLASFVKNGQLRLAAQLKERAASARKSFSQAKGDCKGYLLEGRLAVRNRPGGPAERLAGLDVYASPFFDTEVSLPRLGAPKDRSCAGKPVAQVKVRGERALARACGLAGGQEDSSSWLESLLPYASELSAELHSLTQQRSDDGWWSWQECDGERLRLASHDYPGDGAQELLLESSVPRFDWPTVVGAAPEPQRSAVSRAGIDLSLAVLPWLVGGTLLLSLAGGLVLFISRRIFLADLCEPLWADPQGRAPAPVGRNVFWVGRKPPAEDRDHFACVDLAAVGDGPEAWAARLAELVASPKPILVEGFESRLADRAASARQLDRLDDLVEIEDRTVVVLSRVSPTRLFARQERTSRQGAEADAAQIEERWRALLAGFTIVEDDLRNGASRPARRSALQELWTWLLLARPIQNDTLRQEGVGDELLQRIAQDLDAHARGLSREQILEEFCDRAEKHYRALWASCSPEEKVVLEHLAEEGLVNAKSRKTVRRLMARGLIRRAPNLCLMNETFRRFVASAVCKSQVLSIECEIEPSAWDRFRWPFFAVLSAGIVFFFATQQEALESSLATIASAAAGLPALAKVIELFGSKRPRFDLPK